MLRRTIQIVVAVALQLSANAILGGGGLALAEPIDWTCINGKVVKGLTTNNVPENNALCPKYNAFRSQERAFHHNSDGCSYGDATWKSRFHYACVDHDRCYTTAGMTKKFCDDLFYSRMKFMCDYYPNYEEFKGDCKVLADRWRTGVSGEAAAANAYSTDQMLAEEDCATDPASRVACEKAIALNRDCMWTSRAGDNRGHECYVNGRPGCCGQAGTSGIGACIEKTSTCDCDCIIAKSRVCDRNNAGYKCYDDGQAGWCGIDSSGIPRCVPMAGSCDDKCQEAISRKCTSSNAGYACYDGNSEGVCTYKAPTADCVKVTATCDANCVAAKYRTCTASNKGYQCYDNGQPGWCGIDSSNIPRCVQMAGNCDSKCQEAISRKCTSSNEGYACYQGHTKGTCGFTVGVPDCKI